MIDTTALSIYNGAWFDGSWIAYNTGCTQNWGSGGSGTSSGPGGSSSGDAGDARDILDILNPIRHMAMELFGVSSAHAGSINLGVTPNTIPPITTSTMTFQQAQDWRQEEHLPAPGRDSILGLHNGRGQQERRL